MISIIRILAALFVIVASATACAKPDNVKIIKSGDPDMFYTVETFNGQGAADADFTRVYAHLVNGGKSDRALVLDGEYLVIGKLQWVSAKEVEICLSGGITHTFQSQITLMAANRSETVRNHLQQQCEVGK